MKRKSRHAHKHKYKHNSDSSKSRKLNYNPVVVGSLVALGAIGTIVISEYIYNSAQSNTESVKEVKHAYKTKSYISVLQKMMLHEPLILETLQVIHKPLYEMLNGNDPNDHEINKFVSSIDMACIVYEEVDDIYNPGKFRGAFFSTIETYGLADLFTFKIVGEIPNSPNPNTQDLTNILKSRIHLIGSEMSGIANILLYNIVNPLNNTKHIIYTSALETPKLLLVANNKVEENMNNIFVVNINGVETNYQLSSYAAYGKCDNYNKPQWGLVVNNKDNGNNWQTTVDGNVCNMTSTYIESYSGGRGGGGGGGGNDGKFEIKPKYPFGLYRKVTINNK